MQTDITDDFLLIGARARTIPLPPGRLSWNGKTISPQPNWFSINIRRDENGEYFELSRRAAT